MLRVDWKSHREFEDEYAEVVLGVIAGLNPEIRIGTSKCKIEPVGGWAAYVNLVKDARSVADLSKAFKNLFMLYQKIEHYELCNVMGLNPLKYPIDENDVKLFVKKFLLAEPEKIRKAYLHLKDIKGHPFSKDSFLQYFQKHAYTNMCNCTDIENVKLNVRIMRSLQIRVCPYCGCTLIGGRGDNALGAELDHFINKTDYPFFSVCLYNLIPSCGGCNLHKSNCDNDKLVSPFDDWAAFDSKIGIRWHSRPYVRITEKGQYHESRMEVKVLAAKNRDEYDRYATNIKVFNLSDVYDYFENDAEEYIAKMIRYPKTQLLELEQILAFNNKEEGIRISCVASCRKQLEKDLFLNQCAEADDQVKKVNSKMYADLYRTYRKPQNRA